MSAAETLSAEVLTFAQDRALRGRYFDPASFGHPAKLHLGLLGWIVERYTQPGETICDPMAGTGSLMLAATMGRHVIVRDVEPAYVQLLHANAARFMALGPFCSGFITVGAHDTREPWPDRTTHIITSPPYGCESRPASAAANLSERIHHLSYSSSRWRSLLHNQQLGARSSFLFRYESSHPANIAHWRGARYWTAMRQVYSNAAAALRPGGYMVLILKDHIKDHQRVPVVDDTVALCQSLGFVLVERHARLVYPLSLWQRWRKEKGLPVVEDEAILAFQLKEVS